METLFKLLIVLLFVVAFVVAFVEVLFEELAQFAGRLFQFIGSLFAGAGIYGIITVAGIALFVVSILYIINN